MFKNFPQFNKKGFYGFVLSNAWALLWVSYPWIGWKKNPEVPPAVVCVIFKTCRPQNLVIPITASSTSVDSDSEWD